MQTTPSVFQARKLVTFTVADQLFGITVNKVQDILVPERIAPIPLAPPQVRGAINVRGKIVTVIDVRSRLGLGAAPEAHWGTAITVEHSSGLYTLLVDRVGDVVEVPDTDDAESPTIPDRHWRDFVSGIVKMADAVIVEVDVDRFLDLA